MMYYYSERNLFNGTRKVKLDLIRTAVKNYEQQKEETAQSWKDFLEANKNITYYRCGLLWLDSCSRAEYIVDCFHPYTRAIGFGFPKQTAEGCEQIEKMKDTYQQLQDLSGLDGEGSCHLTPTQVNFVKQFGETYE